MTKGLFIGRSTLDLMSYVETFPEPDQKVKALDDFIGGGGTALNAAVVFSHLGGDCTLFSSFGKEHLYQNIVLDDLEKCSVKTVDICCDENYTIPLSNIISTKATSGRLIINASQNECEKVKRFENLLINDKYDIILLDQYEYSFIRQHRELIGSFNGPIVLDAGTWKSHSKEYLELATIPIVSEEFVKGGPQEFAEMCRDIKAEQWAMTLGAKGVYYSDFGKTGIIPAAKIKAVDTLGAGDIFHGAFCYYYSTGCNFFDSLKNAGEIASKSCSMIGTRSWMEK